MNITKTAVIPNIKQTECIKTLEGPVMVLAGPGTGKTFTVIHRIKYMLETGIAPSAVLCLTYSEAAANEMKAGLVKEIGTIASAVAINTYHAFCNDIIRRYPTEFELLDGAGIIDEITKRTVMKQVLDEVNPEIYRTRWGDAYYFIPELLKSVNEIKSSRITKEEYFNTLNTHPLWGGRMEELEAEYTEREKKGKLVKTFNTDFENQKRKIGKAKETWEIYEKYNLKLKQNNFIDFNDMINMVIDVFDYNEDFLKKVSSQFKYFLVDEYQDTNYSQNNIVFKLAQGAQSRNIFVVGDDDQIIYEFQGAKTDTLEKFLIFYPDTKVICLNENNRSTQNILDFSYDIISRDKTRLEFNPDFEKYNISKVLTAKNPKLINSDEKIQIHGFADIRQENNFIAAKIEDLINSGNLPPNKDGETDLSQIAVLARENIELQNFAKLLELKNIPYQIKESKSIFDIKSSLVIYFYLKALANCCLFGDKLFGLLLCPPFDFANEDYAFLIEQNMINHKDLITNIKENLETRNWSNPQKVKKFITDFDALSRLKGVLNIKDIIIEVINKTGILAYFLQNEENRSDNISAIKKLTDEAEGFMYLNKGAWLGGFLNHLDSAFESNIPITTDKEDYTQNAVQLITLHGSKGRQFEYVFMPNLTAKRWDAKKSTGKMTLPIDKGSKNTDEKTARQSEQLRLLFVGITRAKHSLTLSYSNSIDGRPQELTSYLEQSVQNKALVETYNHEMSKDDYLQELAKGLKKQPFDYAGAFEHELKARIEKFILSPSALNSYLNCPRSFLYSEVLKIPVLDKDNSNANYGSAVHKTLQWSVIYAKGNNRYPDYNTFIETFIKNLNGVKFESAQKREEYQKRGIKSLAEYYNQMTETPYTRIYAAEYLFNYVPFAKYFIKGFIDRIEKNQDGTVELYDYKTGSAKTKTKITDGGEYENYLNQLRFYKLAYELQNENAKVTRAGLIFVEDPEFNYYIDLTNQDNEIIKDKINYVYENINELNFNPPPTEKRNCNYCNYKHLCKLSDL